MLNQALGLTVLAVANLLAIVGIQWLILISIGPGVETDAYVAGQVIPAVIIAVLSGTLSHVLVPLFSSEDKAKLRGLVWAYVLAVGSIFGLVSGALLFLADYWVSVLFPGFSDMGRQLTVDLSRIQVAGMFFVSLSAVLTAAQHARMEFYRAETASLLASSIALVGVYWALPQYGILSAAWIMLGRAILQVALVAPSFGWYTTEGWSHHGFLIAWRRLRPLLMGATIYKLGPVLDAYLGSMVPPGGLSLLTLTQRAVGAVLHVADKAVAAPLIPTLVGYSVGPSTGQFLKVYRRWLLIGLGGATGLCLLFLAGSDSMLTWVLHYGKITEDNLGVVKNLVLISAGMLIGGAGGQISASGLYAIAQTTSITRIAMASFFLSVLVRLLGFHYAGLYGIAFGASFYQISNAILLHRTLNQKAAGQ